MQTTQFDGIVVIHSRNLIGADMMCEYRPNAHVATEIITSLIRDKNYRSGWRHDDLHLSDGTPVIGVSQITFDSIRGTYTGEDTASHDGVVTTEWCVSPAGRFKSGRSIRTEFCLI
jgi:hypothetical protein